MFREAERLSDARLHAPGAPLDAMLAEERLPQARKAFRGLKLRLLEGA